MSWIEPVLGTVLQCAFEPPELAEAAEAACLAEIARLDRIFSRWRDDSELAAVNRGEMEAAGQLALVIAEANAWRERSGGIFDHGAPPVIDLDAIAKGYIVDRALGAALAAGATSGMVNIGGDLACRGSLTVAIENPATPYDNAAPLTRVEIKDAALATSGTARRGQHIRDPRTGDPADVLSVSVIASDAMTADALATVAGILGGRAGCDFAERHGGSCLIVTPVGAEASANWPSSLAR